MPFGGFHWSFILLLLVIVLIIFGPGKLPELGSALGKGINEFRRTTTDLRNEVTRAVETPVEAPAAPAPPPAAPSASEETGTSKSEPPKS